MNIVDKFVWVLLEDNRVIFVRLSDARMFSIQDFRDELIFERSLNDKNFFNIWSISVYSLRGWNQVCGFPRIITALALVPFLS